MKPIFLLASLLALSACHDKRSEGQDPDVPVIPPVVTPRVVTPPVTPPVIPPVTPPEQTHTRAELTLTIDIGERLASGATLSLRQRATGMETSATLSGQGNPTLTLPAGLLLACCWRRPLSLSGSRRDTY